MNAMEEQRLGKMNGNAGFGGMDFCTSKQESISPQENIDEIA